MAADRRVAGRPLSGAETESSRPTSRGAVWALAASVTALGLLGAGAGFVNGDAAVYAAQASRGDLLERVVHVGYLAAAAALAPMAGDALPVWLDRVTAVAAGAVVALTGARRGLLASAVAAAVVLPLAAFAEVDLPWIALLCGALVSAPAGAAILAALAVAVSPTALLALPWASVERRDAAALVGGAIAVGLLTVGSAGAWWVGDRGVLTGPPLLPGRVLEAWAWGLPWLAVLAALAGSVGASSSATPDRSRSSAVDAGWLPIVATAPLLLAPPDVPTVVIVALAVGNRIAAVPATAGVVALVTVQLGLGAVGLARAHARVSHEDRIARDVAGRLGPSVGLVAPWSFGARVGVIATGDPYGPLWRSADVAVRGQGARWCADPPARAVVLEDGRVRWDDGEGWRRVFCGAEGSP